MNAQTEHIEKVLDLIIHDKVEQINDLTLVCSEVKADIDYLIHIWELSKKLRDYKKVETNFALKKVNRFIQNN